MDARPSEYKRQTVLHRVVRESARSAVDEAIVGNLIYMVEMGRHDLRGLMQWILKYLTDHPSIVEELQEYHHAESCMPTLAEACVLETLRLDQAEVLNRSVNKEFVFEGHRIPAGCAVRILLRESHRDSNVFVNPDLFDPHRFIEKTYNSSQYAPFGIGGHRCIAAGLVVRIATIFVEELTSGFSWLKTNDGPRHRGPFHWEPSPEFSIELRSRDSAERREKS